MGFRVWGCLCNVEVLGQSLDEVELVFRRRRVALHAAFLLVTDCITEFTIFVY